MIIQTRKSYKYRIYPSRAQITNLENQFSMCRHLYNWSLAERKAAYKQSGESISFYTQSMRLPALKKERPWYKGVHAQVLQDVLRRLEKAYRSFFRRVKNGEAPGFPKFKKRGRWNSITYPQYRALPSGRISVPKVGEIKTVHHRKIPEEAKIKTMTISRQGCKWFACFSVELALDVEPKQDLQRCVGVDLGLNDFLYASDGSHVPAPKYLRRSLAGLARLQRRLAKAKKRSARYYKLLRAVQKCHYRVRCRRNDWLHKAANDLLARTDVICCEQLNVKGMSRRPKPIRGETDPMSCLKRRTRIFSERAGVAPARFTHKRVIQGFSRLF